MSALAANDAAAADAGPGGPSRPGSLSAIPARLRQGRANRAQLGALLADVEDLAERYDKLVDDLMQVDLRCATSMVLFLALRQGAVRLRAEVAALRALRRRLRARLWAAYRAAEQLRATRAALPYARAALARAELHAAVLRRMHRLAAALAAPHARGRGLHIADAMGALYEAAAQLCAQLTRQVRHEGRAPPALLAVEVALKRVCAHHPHPHALAHAPPHADILASVRTQTVDADPNAPVDAHTPYTAFLAGAIDHDSNTLNALIVAGRPVDAAPAPANL